MNLSNNLQRLMQQHNISPERLAQDVAVPVDTVNGWLAGTQEPEMNQLLVLKQLFSVTLDDLVADAPLSKEKEERYVFPCDVQEDIAHAKAYGMYYAWPNLAGFISASILFAIMYILSVDRVYIAIMAICTIAVAIATIRSVLFIRKQKASIPQRHQSGWRIYTFTENTLHTEVWDETGLLSKENIKKEDVTILIEDADRYTFTAGSSIFGIRKELLPENSVVHSFFAEKIHDNRKHPRFLTTVYEVLQMLSLGNLFLISYIHYDSGLSFAALVSICILMVIISLLSFIVLIISKRKSERITREIIFSVLPLAFQLWFTSSLFREFFFTTFLS